jgi:integrase
MKTPGRPASGQVKWLRNVKTGAFCWHARFTLNGRRTKFAPLDRRIPEHDVEGARECARLAYDFLRHGGAVSDVARETVGEYAQRWIRSRKANVRSVGDNESHLIHHVLPLIGSLDMLAITSANGDTIVARLDAKIEAGEISDKTARNIWGTAKKMFKDAAHAKPATGLRCLQSHPWRDVSPPERVKTKAALQFLYPSEVVSVLNCPSPPRYFRRYIAIAVYLGLRDGEQRMLRWPNVDLQHGVIQVIETFDKRTGGTRDGTKTEAPRLVPIPAPLLPLLRAMHRESGGKGRVCPKMFGQPSMARALRTWLRRAGITRPQLFVRSSVNRPIRWHDLRATCGTWLAVQGRSPTEIRDLLGHTKTDMTDRYLRNATAVRGGHFGEVFGPLPEVLVGEGSLGWVSDLSETQDRKLSKLLTNVVELTGIEPVPICQIDTIRRRSTRSPSHRSIGPPSETPRILVAQRARTIARTMRSTSQGCAISSPPPPP